MTEADVAIGRYCVKCGWIEQLNDRLPLRCVHCRHGSYYANQRSRIDAGSFTKASVRISSAMHVLARRSHTQDVYDYLRQPSIQANGVARDAFRCPVARYLDGQGIPGGFHAWCRRDVFGFTTPAPGMRLAILGPTPLVVCNFIDEFDDGRFPDLETVD